MVPCQLTFCDNLCLCGLFTIIVVLAPSSCLLSRARIVFCQQRAIDKLILEEASIKSADVPGISIAA